ncbi:sulfurtransferase-like selenium metabolism protein YedF [Spirochaetia bacterium]|nr:sulfurtransferase-like selenium metabolism protein YedF [Spirochaetia bacterium]
METIDVTGKPCPIPVIEAKKALRNAAVGSVIQVLVDNDIARQNIEKMAQKQTCGFSFQAREDGTILVSLTVQAKSADASAESGLVVAIGTNTMGNGSDELGSILMKAFIYSLTELDSAPETILFFNSGVRLTIEGSTALKDLKTLEDKGTVLSSCGTCLDFYHVKDKLAIGTVTNMYAIASAMASSTRLINL